MNFEYLSPSSLDEVFDTLGRYENAKIYAGGSDVLLQLRACTIEPDCLVSLANVPDLDFVKEEDNVIRIGAMTTLRTLENSALLRDKLTAVAEGARHVASQKLRNKATVGGNLCQKVKCPYFNQSHDSQFMRDSLAPCFKRGGKVCHVNRYGDDLLHTITGKSYCHAPIPSDLAIVFSALDAVLIIASADGTREVPIREFYRADAEPKIEANEVITEIQIPKVENRGTAYVVYEPSPGVFSVVSAVANITVSDDKDSCREASVWMGGVAQTPYDADDAAKMLPGSVVTSELLHNVSARLFEDMGTSDGETKKKILADDVLFKAVKGRELFRQAAAKAWDRAYRGEKV